MAAGSTAAIALRNNGAAPRELTLVLARAAVPGQSAAAIPQHHAAASARSAGSTGDGGRASRQRPLALRMLGDADRVALTAFDSVQPFALDAPGSRIVEDPTGLASAGSLSPAPRSRARAGGRPQPRARRRRRARCAGPTPPAVEEAAAARWRAALGDVRLAGPPPLSPLFDTLRTALAHVLATREGPALRPGSRSYARVVDPRRRDDVDRSAADGRRPSRPTASSLVRALSI